MTYIKTFHVNRNIDEEINLFIFENKVDFIDLKIDGYRYVLIFRKLKENHVTQAEYIENLKSKHSANIEEFQKLLDEISKIETELNKL